MDMRSSGVKDAIRPPHGRLTKDTLLLYRTILSDTEIRSEMSAVRMMPTEPSTTIQTRTYKSLDGVEEHVAKRRARRGGRSIANRYMRSEKVA